MERKCDSLKKEISKFIIARKRKKMIRKLKFYGAVALIILLPIAIMVINHLLKKKIKQAVKSKVESMTKKETDEEI